VRKGYKEQQVLLALRDLLELGAEHSLLKTRAYYLEQAQSLTLLAMA
jgi:hypothetical protein